MVAPEHRDEDRRPSDGATGRDTAVRALDAALRQGDVRAARSVLREASGAEGDDGQVADLLDLLACRAAAHDEVAFELLVEEVDRRGLAVAGVRRVLVDREAVEEAAQDTLVVLASAIGSFRGESRFTTWLFAVARNRAVDLLRRSRDGGRVAAPSGVAGLDTPVTGHGMSTLLAGRQRVEELLGHLDAETAELVRLRDVVGVPYDQLAERYGASSSTLRSRVARARARLARVLEHEVTDARDAGGAAS